MRERAHVWSRAIRLFHWLNVLCILLLVGIGLVIFNAKTLGVSVEGKVLLKTLHVIVGYVFAINLVVRLVIGIIGRGYEKLSYMLPFTPSFFSDLKAYNNDKAKVYTGHNPLGRLMIAALMLCMILQMVTGLFLAGSDIYYPPFGQTFAKQIAIDKNNLSSIKPYSKDNVDESAYKELRQLRKPFITIHVYSFYALLLLIPLHIFGVIRAERSQKSALVSAMITGDKYFPQSKK